MAVQVVAEPSAKGLRPVDTGQYGLAPFVKWAGGKGSIIRHLMPYVPDHLTDYYEPFLGGGALFLAICSRTTAFTAHLSDINGELINAYRVVKDGAGELIEQLGILQYNYYSTVDKESYFYEMRAWEPKTRVESAARLIFLNKTCYNGLYRVNSHGQFNVPFGDYKKPTILDSERINSVSQALRNTDARLVCLDYREAIVNCRKGDFVYFDPPYDPTSKTSSFTEYSSAGFSEHDQNDLAGIFSKLVQRKCKVLLSNSNTSLVNRLFKGFPMRDLRVARPINSVGSRRKNFQELIISS